MDNVVVIEAVRTPTGKGKPGGQLSGLHPVELLAQTLIGLVERTGIDPGTVDDVIIGCVSQVGEQSATPGRMAWLAAGYPVHVPSTTIDRKCGSSQQAMAFAAQGIMAGFYDVVIAGGVEVMSRVPMGSARMGADPYGPSVTERFAPGLVPQGVSAELVATKWGITREEMDEYSLRSHLRAHALAESGVFDAEIVPISTPEGLVIHDETIRGTSTLEGLTQLKPAFENDEYSARFPQIEWGVTAGNSSQITDGASAVLLMSETRANQLGLTPIARLVSFAVVADDPILMLTAPIPATKKVLERTGLALSDFAHVEVNEAFASVPLAWQRAFDAPDEIVNPSGGAIAFGHPLGASGARLFTTMIHSLRRNGQRWGLQTMCEAGGMANATVVEAL
jgi:acetyl-CoA acyltransferase